MKFFKFIILFSSYFIIVCGNISINTNTHNNNNTHRNNHPNIHNNTHRNHFNLRNNHNNTHNIHRNNNNNTHNKNHINLHNNTHRNNHFNPRNNTHNINNHNITQNNSKNSNENSKNNDNKKSNNNKHNNNNNNDNKNNDIITTEIQLNKYYNNLIKSNTFNKNKDNNCSLQLLSNALNYASNNNHKELLLTTPCIDEESFGNYLSDYIESRICANITGLHFISLFNKSPSSSNSMISYLPEVIFNTNQNINGLEIAIKICTCHSICHENPYALLQSEVHMVRDILRPIVLQYYHENLMKKKNPPSILSTFWKSVLKSPYKQETSKLPEIPDVSIHYRCGDNTVGHYGFLAFPAFLNRIPANVSTIYILSESISRKSTERRVTRCNSILTSLLTFLSTHYPSATIGLIRGGNIFDDFIRLSLSSITICSVSTFCYYAGMSSINDVYFPITRLFAKATAPFYSSNIHWLDKYPSESVLLGQEIQYQPDKVLIRMLQSPTGSRPTPPPYIDLKKKPVQKYTTD